MRKDERGASTRPDARMTCEGDTSKVEVRTLPVRGLAVTERPQRNLISKPTCLYRTCKGFDPLDPKGRTYANSSSSPVLPPVTEGAECARTDAIEFQNPLSLITSSHLLQIGSF